MIDQYMDDEGNLTPDGYAMASMGLSIITQACHKRAVSKGWWPKASDGSVGRNFGEMLALMHSELSEALEAYRDNDNMQEIRYEYPNDPTEMINESPTVLYVPDFTYADGHVELGKPVGVASEFADVFIRIADTAVALGIPFIDAIMQKHEYNATRAHRHGNKKC